MDGRERIVVLRKRVAKLVGALAICASLASAAVARAGVGPYFAAPFKTTKLDYGFGQAPSWTRDGRILSRQLDSTGISQIYRARTDGSGQTCLTCRTVKGPNGLPDERPQGDWILFESYGQQPVHLGAPGLGGYGGDLYVMRPDGSHPYRLTTDSDPDDGAPYGSTTGVPYDNFHAHFSPDGGHLIWTHTEAQPLAQGGETWSMLLGDFRVTNGRPALENVRVVGRPYGAYETQPWSPDGKGFLFSAAGGLRSPFQATPPGWGNMRLYYMRLYGRGASPAHPRVTLIGDNAPLYQEQAIFTPDMRTVVMMSNRAATVGSWYVAVAAAAQRTRFDAPNTGATQTLQFLADFNGPDFRSDLFAVDVGTGAIRRLTRINRVIPEFYWNHDYTKVLWGLGGGFATDTYVGRFLGITRAQRRVPARTPAALYGKPVEMSRVGAQAQPVRDPGPTDNAAVPVAPPGNPAPGLPHAVASSDIITVTSATATYLAPWLADLKALGDQVGATFTTDAVGRLGLGP
jgi:Tol biopolymer transport system component